METRPSETGHAGMSRVGFGEAVRFWLKLGFISFGGPTGQIAIMHEELVERRRWIGESRFLHALNYCMLLPGPEAQQLAIYVGWLLHRTAGGLVAGTLFVLPGALVLLALSWLYAAHGTVPAVSALFHGLRAAVIAIVAQAVIRIGAKALRRIGGLWIAAAAFVAMFFVRVPFPLVVLGGALVGLIIDARIPNRTSPVPAEAPGGGGALPTAVVLSDDDPLHEHTRPTLARALRVTVAGLVAWWLPLGAVIAWRGADDVLSRQAVFFSKAAMVTFGGAYAVLAYIDQAAVQHYHWLAQGQMLDGLGLAETTPGPLILVTEFVGFLGAYNNPGGLDPRLAGVLGAAVTVWATFAPCFLWIFLGAPYVEGLRGNSRLNAALSAITAVVLGAILNLAVGLGLHTLFHRVSATSILGMTVPVVDLLSIDFFAVTLAGLTFVGMRRWGWGIIPVVAGSAAAGLAYHFAS